ncbi:MAG: hypothetical protein M3P32_07240 [Chloroflexota bacterium]|nr:hypothetical protein [Chloroflexota bacterium]
MPRNRAPALPLALVLALLLAGCGLIPSPTPSVEPSTEGTSTAEPSATPEPSPSEDQGLTLPTPPTTDLTAIGYTVTVELEAGGSGRLVVVVTNQTQDLVQELVLRWPTAVRDTIFLAPFEPSTQRIREGGDPLVQDWTRWVDGPGEHAEPAGTTSLGWGPLLPGATLTIPVLATRVAPGPLTFDLQFLNGGAILVSDGVPAWTQVSVP